MIRVADYVMKRISEEGVEHVFYVPGTQCVYLLDAIRRNKDLEGVAMHHEQAASMAALSYSLYNNNFGACLVTTGCGGTNTMTGVLHAWQDNIPCIFISGQQIYRQTIKASGLPLRAVGVQEADIENIMKPITKFSVTVEEKEKIAFWIRQYIWRKRDGKDRFGLTFLWISKILWLWKISWSDIFRNLQKRQRRPKRIYSM